MFRIYTTLYHTYQLLYCKGDVQITSAHSIINMERKAIDLLKLKHWIDIQLEFILHYITLTNNYIVKDTFRS